MMVMRERVAAAVVLVLMGVGGWFAFRVLGDGLSAGSGREMLVAAAAIVVLTAVAAGVAALTGRGAGRQVDERDNRIALRSQVVRGFFYLVLAFGLLGLAVGDGDIARANAIFLAILGIEIVSGLVMLALYRVSA